jgi:hypothetical protein
VQAAWSPRPPATARSFHPPSFTPSPKPGQCERPRFMKLRLGPDPSAESDRRSESGRAKTRRIVPLGIALRTARCGRDGCSMRPSAAAAVLPMRRGQLVGLSCWRGPAPPWPRHAAGWQLPGWGQQGRVVPAGSRRGDAQGHARSLLWPPSVSARPCAGPPGTTRHAPPMSPSSSPMTWS